jgi:hypothetical protein
MLIRTYDLFFADDSISLTLRHGSADRRCMRCSSLHITKARRVNTVSPFPLLGREVRTRGQCQSRVVARSTIRATRSGFPIGNSFRRGPRRHGPCLDLRHVIAWMRATVITDLCLERNAYVWIAIAVICIPLYQRRLIDSYEHKRGLHR